MTIHIHRRSLLKASAAFGAFAAVGGLAACTQKPALDPNPVVATTYGKVRGALEDGITVFKGVRYGADTAATASRHRRATRAVDRCKDALAYANSAPQAARRRWRRSVCFVAPQSRRRHQRGLPLPQRLDARGRRQETPGHGLVPRRRLRHRLGLLQRL